MKNPELLRDLHVSIIDNNKKRVELYFMNEDNERITIGEFHPEHADDIIKVYNRNADRYDWLY